ncbi:MAG: type II CRISPR RNA-guided endonuclease Cas9 [Clostridia bacterium]|nr:type II CRISPR RNA-guided endonuclease Cas9 [Clostridia bacterium]
MNYRIGLDIGITSVGWAVIENNEYGDAVKIIDLNSRIFDAAETPKDGSSLALPRREARGARRRNNRKKYRILRTKKLLVDKGILTEQEIDKLYSSNISKYNIYELRVAGLDRKLRENELAQVLINFVKKRGYKSNSKAEELRDDNKETGKALTSINENEQIMKKNNYRTVGEMYLKDDKFKVRSSDGLLLKQKDVKGNLREILKTRNTTNEYKTTVQRSLLLDEIKTILDIQSKFNEKITDDFKNKYIEIFESQRNFDEGPGKPSPYGGNLIENMFGKCTFEKDEKRASKATFTFEMFKFLQDINHIKLEEINLLTKKNDKLYHKSNKESKRVLTNEEKEILLNEFKKTDNLSYNRIRKILNIPYNYLFNVITYDFSSLKENNNKDIIDENEKKVKKFEAFKSYHVLRRALNRVSTDYIYSLDEEKLNEIGYILTAYKSDIKRKERLEKLNLSNEIIDELIKLSFSKTGHLSIKAMKKIIPHLKEGLTYDKACNIVYKDFRGLLNTDKKNKLSLNDIENIPNPVVRRAISQSIKVINAIVSKYGSPDLVVIELAREMSRNFDDRNKDRKSNEENMKYNELVKERIQNEYKQGLTVTGQDIVKYKLWQEQGETCPYSGQHIDITELFTSNVDIDHIIPYSICFNDSYNNKVLVKADENRQKGNQIPYQYILNMNRNIDEYIVRINNMYQTRKTYSKKKSLLKEVLDEEEMEGFKDRNLSDTQYITKVIYNLLRNNLKFNESKFMNKPVYAVNGRITAHVRKMLGINKIREDGDIHHAIDAVVIANISESMIKKITDFYKHKENKYIDSKNIEEFNSQFPEPWRGFRNELDARCMSKKENIERAISSLKLPYYLPGENLKPIFVSRMPRRKVTGSAHKDTIRAITRDGFTVIKTDLKKLKLKDGEIDNYYNPQDDTLLYNALKQRLIEYDNNGEKAFLEPFYKPKSDGTNGPLVKKVKILSKSTLNVKLDKINAVADNGDMIRIDIFYVENEGYYFVPIYVSDTIKKEMPNKASVAGKPYEEWKEMKDEDFIFSLYPNDLMYVKSKRGIKLTPMNKNSFKEDVTVEELFGYYNSSDISTASIQLTTHDRALYQRGIGVKTLTELKKYQVDILGSYTEVKIPEKRMRFNFKK